MLVCVIYNRSELFFGNISGNFRNSCHGSSWTVETAGEHREAHQPRDTGGKDSRCWYPVFCLLFCDFTCLYYSNDVMKINVVTLKDVFHENDG